MSPSIGPSEDSRARQGAEVEAGRDRTVDRQHRLPLGRRDLGMSLAVGLVTLVIYLFTLAPGLLQDDSAELQTLAVTLGYAHPTGYPVHLLMAKLATAVPIGEVAYRVNLLSAIMGAVAAVLVYLLGKLLTGRSWVPAAGALGLAVSPTFWSQAIIAEVYTSGVVCMVGVLVGLEIWRQTGEVRWLFAAACLGGVSLGVHATVALMAPSALLMLVLAQKRRRANWTAAVCGALSGAAITLLAFAVIDRADGPTSYFRTVIYPSRSVWSLEPEDLDGFLDRVKLSMSAPQFAGLLTSQEPAVTRQKAVDYGVNLAREFPLPWLILAAAGLVWLFRRNAKMALVLALTYLTHLCYDLQFDGVVHVMYIATYVPIAILGIAGLAAACEGCRDLAARFGRRQRPAAAYDLLVALVTLGVVGWPMLWPDAWKDGRRDFWLPPGEQDAFRLKDSARFHRQVHELIEGLEPDAVVFTGWCTLYPYYYVAHVELGRCDLVFIQDYPHPGQKELADSALEYVKKVAPHRPVYFTHKVKKVAEVFQMRPVHRGWEILYRVGEPIGPLPSLSGTRPERPRTG